MGENILKIKRNIFSGNTFPDIPYFSFQLYLRNDLTESLKPGKDVKSDKAHLESNNQSNESNHAYQNGGRSLFSIVN